ncbi:methyltransferase domain-containing protein [Streptomyces monashensis]|uniref:class I SAM-dependent methyltransferase n=1 Tax=Streptomyces monashensis TaxID=1678012 RepID=UPI0009A0CE65
MQTAFDESERRAWAGQADAYAASFAELCAYPVRRLLDAVGVREGTHVLDVGTGTGSVGVVACERGAKVTAVDAEPGMVARAAQAAPEADVRLATTIGQIVTSRSPVVIAEIKARSESLCAEFTGPGGVLVLPHAALTAHGRA